MDGEKGGASPGTHKKESSESVERKIMKFMKQCLLFEVFFEKERCFVVENPFGKNYKVLSFTSQFPLLRVNADEITSLQTANFMNRLYDFIKVSTLTSKEAEHDDNEVMKADESNKVCLKLSLLP